VTSSSTFDALQGGLAKFDPAQYESFSIIRLKPNSFKAMKTFLHLLPQGRQFSGLMMVFWLKVCWRWLIRPPEAIVRKYAGPPRVWVECAEADGFALGRRMPTGVLPSGSSQDDSIKSRIDG
jgi:hypothetical protein